MSCSMLAVANTVCENHWPRLEYASDFRVGACYLRPHMLGYRADFGYAGCCEPEDLINLCQLIISEG